MNHKYRTFISFLTCFILSFCLGNINAQEKQVSLDPKKTTFKDSQGREITFSDFIELTAVPDHILDPVFNADGELLEMYVIYPPFQSNKSEEVETVVEKKNDFFEMEVPNFSLTNIEGQAFDKENLQNKIVVFNFWFTNCGPCREEIPQLNELVSEHPNVVFLAPTFDKKAKVQNFITKQSFDYHILADAKDFVNQMGIIGYPTHMVMDKNGKVRSILTGSHNMKTRLKKLIADIEQL